MGDVFVFGAGVCSSGIVMPISKLQDVSDTSDSEEERWKPTLILPVLINESEADKGASLVKREITETNTSGLNPGEIVISVAPALPLPPVDFDLGEEEHFLKSRFDSKENDEEWIPDMQEASESEEDEWFSEEPEEVLSPVRSYKRLKRGLRAEKHLKSIEASTNRGTRSKRKMLKSTHQHVMVDFGSNHTNVSEVTERSPANPLSAFAGEVRDDIPDADVQITVEEPIPSEMTTAPALPPLNFDHDEDKHFSKLRFDSKDSDEEEWTPDPHEASDNEEEEWSPVRVHKRIKRGLRSEKHLKSRGAPSNLRTRSKRKLLKSTHKQVLHVVDFDPNHTNASESVPTKVLTAFAGGVENAVPDAGVDITVEEPLAEVVVSVAPVLSPLNFDPDRKKHFPKSRFDSKESDEEEWTPDPHEASDNEDEEWVVDEPEVLSPVRFYKRLKLGLRSEKHLKSHEDPISRQTRSKRAGIGSSTLRTCPSTSGTQ